MHYVFGPYRTITDHDLIIPVLDRVVWLAPEDEGPFDSGVRISNITVFKDFEPRYEFDITVTSYHSVEFHINFIEIT